ncbi:hypothetical protein PACTADRAFT_50578 [Pachysolen tannophilus NRRL Y-2460]|uniref:Cell division control protein 25 n=1 Tax=Pachysolen tannophilus NRRL Y-2460 TaxID=669874 RepID=A0A1E4TSJ9_PACTA|nr:hypothetical protein PACTADRAFT_50578 [Pachysolen tannophilus NRRL Y-2460]
MVDDDDDIPPEVPIPQQKQESVGTNSNLRYSAKFMDVVKVINEYKTDKTNQLNLVVDQTVYVLTKSPTGWWDGLIQDGPGEPVRGWFPSNYTKSIYPINNSNVMNNSCLSYSNLLKQILMDDTNISSSLTSATGNNGGNSNNSNGNITSGNSRKNSIMSITSSEHSQKESASAIPTQSSTPNTQGGMNPDSFEDPMIHTTNFQSKPPGNDEINILTIDEVNALCKKALGTSNEPPVWLPRLTADGAIIYYNERFNAYCNEMPFISVPQVDETSILRFPKKLELSRLENITSLNDGSAEKLNYEPAYLKPASGVSTTTTAPSPAPAAAPASAPAPTSASAHAAATTTSPALSGHHSTGSAFAESSAGNNQRSSYSFRKYSKKESIRSSIPASIYSDQQQQQQQHQQSYNPCPLFYMDDLFYGDRTDMRYWKEFFTAFLCLVDATLDGLRKCSTDLFFTNYNDVTKLCAFFNLSARLTQNNLVNQGFHTAIQRKLKKMTSGVAQLGVNGRLHLRNSSTVISADIPEPASKDDDHSSIDTDSLHSSTLGNDPVMRRKVSREMRNNTYLKKAELDGKSLKLRAEACFKIFSNLKFEDGHDPKLAAMVYPRFMKDVFDGGNWTNDFFIKPENPFKLLREEKNGSNAYGKNYIKTYADKYNSNKPKILLDKDAVATLESKKSKLAGILNDVLKSLETEPPEDVNPLKFREQRNVTVLTMVYNALQPSARILDILEAFDFSVFKAIKKLPMEKENSSSTNIIEDSSSLLGDSNSVSGTMSNQDSSSLPQRCSSSYFDKQSVSNSSKLINAEVVSYTYPILIEFFEAKQELYDSFSELVIDAQALTLDDPEVFKSLRQDDEMNYSVAAAALPTEKLAAALTALITENDIKNETNECLQFRKEDKLRSSIAKLGKSLGLVIYLVQQLIDERESILNYTSRKMNVDFDVEIFMNERHSTVPDLIDDYKGTYTHERRSSNDVPWYLDIDEAEYSLIYDSKGNVKGGTIDGLVAHLTSNEERSPEFTEAFLLTFRSFMKPGELLERLVKIYNSEPPEGLSFEEYNIWHEKKLYRVRENVISILDLLVTKYWNYNYYDSNIFKNFKFFMNTVATSNIPGADIFIDNVKYVTLESQKADPNSVGSLYKVPKIYSKVPPPPPIMPRTLRRLKLKDIDFTELARQLTLREFVLYSKITQMEFLDKMWGSKHGNMGSSHNIKFFISYANKLSNFVSFMIIRKKEIKKRADTITYFIQVADKCLQYKNYSTLTAIISALSSSPIARLKKTWALVGKNFQDSFKKMDKLMSIDRNYNEYRDLLKFVKEAEPCIPFLGIYLTDLTFVSQAIPDFINRDRSMINFYKRYKVHHIVTEALKYEKYPYNFHLVHEIQIFLDNWFNNCPDVNEQHKLSLILEPRVSASIYIY